MPRLSLPPATPPRPMGWVDVKELYLLGVQIKEIARVSGFSRDAISDHAEDERWGFQRTELHAAVKHLLYAKYGQDAKRQTEELFVLEARVIRLAERILAATERGEAASKDDLRALAILQPAVTQAIQSMRLLMGQATERKENVSLEALVVEWRTWQATQGENGKRGEESGRQGGGERDHTSFSLPPSRGGGAP